MKKLLLAIAGFTIAIRVTIAVETATPPAAAPAGFTGKVAETMTTSSYTYVLVDTGTKKSWAAAPQFEVKVGDTVTVAPGLPMDKYHSKSLNRDFDTVYFTGEITVGDKDGKVTPPAGKLPEGHPPIKPLTGATAQLPAGHPEIKGVTDKPAVDLKGIKPVKGGKTVAEIYAGKKKLAGKSVSVRGKVVKYNADIMGKNWLHVQDGTGKDGDNDLMVTSKTEAKVGDTVLVKGAVSLDKDFGAGYKYSVILDDAEVVVE
ncbi:MAG: nucleotide-binding protein [Verrucomicrobia bacterium]|nr:nucleotide-binding protein [Verrucomicrobiota bacterium]